MKKYLLIAITALFLSSCGSMKLVGNYPSNNHFAETDLSLEQVWTRIIDFFAISGVPIKLIDKASGLIVSEEISFKDSYTIEEKGLPVDLNALVVVPNGYNSMLILSGGEMLGSWNVRIKPTENKTIVNVNMTNLSCYSTSYSLFGVTKTSIPIASTGVWEKQFLEFLTK